MLKFPYGISDFYKIITEDYVYIDRTDRIRLVEETGVQLLFLRPRRFGKSLWLSTLENYYDVAKAQDFEKLFGELEIGENPTSLHNKYLVLSWDFSAVKTSDDIAKMEQALYEYINETILNFTVRYAQILSLKVNIIPNALVSFQSMLTAVQQTPYKLYLLIDEYDNFANEILMGGAHHRDYESLVKGEGLLKTLFKNIKVASNGRGLDRVFITGVSPLVLSDISSGYNISESIYLEKLFNNLCGFEETEIVQMLRVIVDECQFSKDKTDEALEVMRTYYNGYSFSPDEENLIYNPTLVLYFLKYFQNQCTYPKNMLDENLAMDENKLSYIASWPKGTSLILEALQEDEPIAITELYRRFSIREIISSHHDSSTLTLLLHYFGILTLAGYNAFGEFVLTIPNLVIKRLYAEKLQEICLPENKLEDVRLVARSLYQKGDLEPACKVVENYYFKVLDNRDYRRADELTVKTAFLTLLFNDMLYIMDSEAVLERSYADLSMILRPQARQYQLFDLLIEFKFIPLGKLKLSQQDLRQSARENLMAHSEVQVALKAASKQLQHYQEMLRKKYGEVLRLRSYAVVSLGFERLLWIEVLYTNTTKNL